MFRIIDNKDSSNYRIGIKNTPVTLLLFSAISILKKKRFLRNVIGSLGFICLIAGVIGTAKFSLTASMSLPVPKDSLVNVFLDYHLHLLFLGIIQLSLFLLSVSFIEFVMENGKRATIQIETEKAEEKYEKEPKDPFSYLELDTKKIYEYYSANQRQAKSSFNLATFAMVIGLLTIITGVSIFYQNSTKLAPSSSIAGSLSTLAGIVVNMVSVLFIRFHDKAQARSIIYFGQLLRNQQLGLSYRIALNLNDEQKIDAAKQKIVDSLLRMVENQADDDSKRLDRELHARENGGKISVPRKKAAVKNP